MSVRARGKPPPVVQLSMACRAIPCRQQCGISKYRRRVGSTGREPSTCRARTGWRDAGHIRCARPSRQMDAVAAILPDRRDPVGHGAGVRALTTGFELAKHIRPGRCVRVARGNVGQRSGSHSPAPSCAKHVQQPTRRDQAESQAAAGAIHSSEYTPPNFMPRGAPPFRWTGGTPRR